MGGDPPCVSHDRTLRGPVSRMATPQPIVAAPINPANEPAMAPHTTSHSFPPSRRAASTPASAPTHHVASTNDRKNPSSASADSDQYFNPPPRRAQKSSGIASMSR